MANVQTTMYLDRGTVHVAVDSSSDQGERTPVEVSFDGAAIARCWTGAGAMDILVALTTEVIGRAGATGAATVVHPGPDGPTPVHLSGARLRELLHQAVATGGHAYALPGGQIHLTLPALGSAVAFENPSARRPECRHCGWWASEHADQPCCPGFEGMGGDDLERCSTCDGIRAAHDWDPLPTCGRFAVGEPDLPEDDEDDEEFDEYSC
ncbi:hypothetical protein OG871_39505 (plasmid) [Kitasatospora sp. NBC_00374]|uniref:hypothetical protein n=1 Tax=Kitasatospora sp. NBC_00374 TaxID=2975964 RepID=UPI00324D09C1